MAKVLCMCGKEIGCLIGKFLMTQEHEIRYVVNDYERPGSWYRTPRELEIEEIAYDDIPLFAPDLIVVAFYDKILPESVFSLPRFGTWNLHLGDAERYRGAYPNVWAIRNGDEKYTVTLHRIDSGIDTGPILAKRTFPLPKHYTGKDLYEKMTQEGASLFGEYFERLVSGRALALARPQSNEGVRTYYRSALRHELDVSEEFKNQVRALTFPPFPPPFFRIGSREFIVIERPKKQEMEPSD